MRTFAGNPPYPARRDQWEEIARAADQLLAQRSRRYPAAVDAGDMTQDQADRGIRTMSAIAELWRRVAAHEDLVDPGEWLEDLGATWRDMHGEASTLTTALMQAADKDPDNIDLRARAEVADAMRWHLEPTMHGGSYPHIWLAHDYAQWERRRAEALAA